MEYYPESPSIQKHGLSLLQLVVESGSKVLIDTYRDKVYRIVLTAMNSYPDDAKLIHSCCVCVTKMAALSVVNKVALLKLSMTMQIVRILRKNRKNLELVEAACDCLAVLSDLETASSTMMKSNEATDLAQSNNPGSGSADFRNHQKGHHWRLVKCGVFKILFSVMKQYIDQESVVISSCRTIANLSRDETARKEIEQYSGLDILKVMVERYSESSNILGEICFALRGFAMDEAAVDMVVNAKIDVLILKRAEKLLHEPSRKSTTTMTKSRTKFIIRVCELVKQLATVQGYKTEKQHFLNLGIMQYIIHVLQSEESIPLKSACCETMSVFLHTAGWDTVSNGKYVGEDVIEAILDVSQFCRQNSRAQVASISCLERILNSNSLDSRSKTRMFHSDVLDSVIQAIRVHSDDCAVVEHAFGALRRLKMEEFDEELLEPILTAVHNCIGKPVSSRATLLGLQIISEISSQTGTKRALIDAGVAEVICDAMKSYGTNREIQVAACSALYNLVSQFGVTSYSSFQHIKSSLQDLGVAKYVIEATANFSDSEEIQKTSPVIERAIGSSTLSYLLTS